MAHLLLPAGLSPAALAPVSLAHSTFDLLDQRGLVIGLLIGVATIPGAFAARWMISRLSASVHVTIIEAMVVIAGLSFIWRAWQA